jgi:PAS domain S-box-containing protein
VAEQSGLPGDTAKPRRRKRGVQAEETLRASDVRYRHALDNLLEGCQIIGFDWRYLYINASAARHGRQSREELLGRTMMERYPGIEDTKMFAALRQCMEKRIPQHLENEFVYPDGGKGWFELSVQPVPDGVFILSFDVTERKRAEAELKQKNRELEQILFAASHDLRSPLVNIQGFSRELAAAIEELQEALKEDEIPPRLRKRCAPLLQEDIPESIGFITSSIAKMDTLLDGLLQLSRVGRQELNPKTLDMNRLLSGVVQSLAFRIREGKIRLEVDRLPLCCGDEELIGRLFSNLLDNAVKFLAPDRPGRIHVSGDRAKEQAVYRVQDNGIGIEDGHMANVFKLFHQLDPSRKGFGLGLSIVNRIVEKHGGTIRLESQPGRGSTFIVSLPGAQEQLEIPETGKERKA